MTSTNLQDNEQLALQGLIETLQTRYSEKLREVFLYGSKARGDSTPDSDIDILIILSDEDEQIRRDILTIASQYSLEYDVLISPHVIGETRFNQKRGFTYYRNAVHDAVLLNITGGKLTLSPGIPMS